MTLLGGSYVRWHMYQSDIYSPFKKYFTPINGEHGPLCILAIPLRVVQPWFVNGGQSKGAKWPRGGEGAPTVGRFFWKFVYENEISCTLNGIIRGLVYVKWHIPIPYSPLLLKNYFTPIKGAGAWPLVPLAMPVTVVQPGFVNGGAKARERSDRAWGGCGRGFPPPTGSEIFQNLCLKTAFSCTLDTIIRGSLYSGIDQFPTLVLFHSFPNEFVSGKHFPFPFLSSFVLLADKWGRGAWPPCAS